MDCLTDAICILIVMLCKADPGPCKRLTSLSITSNARNFWSSTLKRARCAKTDFWN